MAIRSELIDELLKSCDTPAELLKPGGFLRELTGRLVEAALEAEMTNHLGFERNAIEGWGSGNSRNGATTKQLKTESGEVTIAIPRDRNGTFEPQLVRKHQRRVDGLDEKILSMYARGMSVRDIQEHLRELYSTDVSGDLISSVTDAVLSELGAWQNRPLDAVWPVLFLDALVVKVRDQGVVKNKHIYVALGINTEGRKEVLGLWMETTEGARFWLKVVTELKNRGVQDVLIACCDGLKGFPEAIEAVFSKATVQTCLVHQVRASLRYVTEKERKAVAHDLRLVYTAPTEAAALEALAEFEKAWGDKYPTVVRQWRTNWERITPFLAFPQEIRRVIYTTNSIESLNFTLRKSLRNRGHFPTDDAALKLVYMAITRVEKTWKMPFRDWNKVVHVFAIHFENRLPLT